MADDDNIRQDEDVEERQNGPRVAKSKKNTKRYSKRIILVFILAVAALLFVITVQAQMKKRADDESWGQEKTYRAPLASGFAELAADMRRDRRPDVAAIPAPVPTPASQEPVLPEQPQPEKSGQRVVIRKVERPASPPPPRYYSNEHDADTANTLRLLKEQALLAKPVVADFMQGLGDSEKSDAQKQAQNPGAGYDPSAVDATRAIMSALGLGQQQNGQNQTPNMQAQKAEFLRNGGGALTPQGYSANVPFPQQFPYELKAGTIIPGIMLTGINSDLPGNVIAQVSENVWDTATGRHVLIPKGTRMLGAYDSNITYGQKRVLLVWNRLIFPNGTTLDIKGSPGIDQAGYSGLSGKLNEHWGEMLKSALIATVFVAGAEMVYDSDENQNQNQNKSPSDVAAESAANTILEMSAKLTSRAMNIQPTITIRPGKRMGIFVQQDVVFPYPYF